MNFYKQAALALDHLDTKQGSVKGSVAAAGVAQGNESKRVLACESGSRHERAERLIVRCYSLSVVIESLKCALRSEALPESVPKS